MRLKILIIIVNLLFISRETSAEIRYDLTFLNEKIHVKARFGNNKSRTINMHVPKVVWGADYSKQIKNINIKNGYYDSSNCCVILNNNTTELEISYDVVNVAEYEFLQAFSSIYYHFFDKNKFFLIGLGFFIYPHDLMQNPNEAVSIYIHNKNKLKIASNVKPYLHKNNKIKTKLQKLEEIFVLGNTELSLSKNDYVKLNVITWSVDKILRDRVSRIAGIVLNNQKNFWGDNDTHKVMIFIPNPIIVDQNRTGGANINDTIINFINPNKNEDYDIYNLVSHENLHSWFGPSLLDGPTWFVEGFTEYFAHLINMKTGIISKEDFDKKHREFLDEFSSSKYKNVSDKELENLFWKDIKAQKMPYIKGFLIAYNLDLEIQKYSKGKYSLKDIFVEMIFDARKNKEKLVFSNESLLFYLRKNAIELDLRVIEKNMDLSLTHPSVTKHAKSEIESFYTL